MKNDNKNLDQLFADPIPEVKENVFGFTTDPQTKPYAEKFRQLINRIESKKTLFEKVKKETLDRLKQAFQIPNDINPDHVKERRKLLDMEYLFKLHPKDRATACKDYQN